MPIIPLRCEFENFLSFQEKQEFIFSHKGIHYIFGIDMDADVQEGFTQEQYNVGVGKTSLAMLMQFAFYGKIQKKINMDKIINKFSKRNLFSLYGDVFNQVSGIKLFQEPENCKSNYWLQTLILEEHESENLQKILELTNESQIMTRPSWVLLNELKPFLDCPSMDLVVAKSLSSRIINIPSSSNLGNI